MEQQLKVKETETAEKNKGGRPKKDSAAAQPQLIDLVDATVRRLMASINADLGSKNSTVTFKEKVDYLGKLLQYAMKHEEGQPKVETKSPNELAAYYLNLQIKAGIKKGTPKKDVPLQDLVNEEINLLSEPMHLCDSQESPKAKGHVKDPS